MYEYSTCVKCESGASESASALSTALVDASRISEGVQKQVERPHVVRGGHKHKARCDHRKKS